MARIRSSVRIRFVYVSYLKPYISYTNCFSWVTLAHVRARGKSDSKTDGRTDRRTDTLTDTQTDCPKPFFSTFRWLYSTPRIRSFLKLDFLHDDDTSRVQGRNSFFLNIFFPLLFELVDPIYLSFSGKWDNQRRTY